jgi:YbbR domain-containing protein
MFRHYRTLVLAVAIAFFLWFYVKSAATFRMVVDVPVAVTNLPHGYVLVSDLPGTIPVEFEADGKTLLGLQYLWDVRYVLDLADYRDGTPIVLSDFPGNVKWPEKSSARIASFPATDTLRIYSEQQITRRVPVQADVMVRCKPGFVLVGGIRLTPDSIAVVGPKSLVESIRFLKTESRAFEGIAEDQFLSLKILRPDSKKLTYEDRLIDVALDIQPLAERTMDNIPVRLVQVPDPVQAVVQPSTFSVKIRGGVDLLATVTRDSIQGVINYAEEQRLKRVEALLTVTVPADVQWSQLIPSRFKIVHLTPVP